MNFPTELNDDDLSDLLGSDVTPTTKQAPEGFKSAAERVFTEACPKCGGSGSYGRVSSLGHSKCLKCNGTGRMTFKTDRATQERKQSKAQVKADLYYASNPDIAEWIIKNPGFGFAVSLGQAVQKYGSLTDNQAAAARRCITKETERVVQRQAEVEARTVSIGNGLMEAFNVAKAKQAAISATEKGTRKSPRLTFGAFFVEEARRHPGTLYVTTRGGEYYGKVIDGRFSASRECPQDVRDNVAELVRDPKATAIAYGKRFGVCCVCNRTLTDPDSIEAGIGPICATKMGW